MRLRHARPRPLGRTRTSRLGRLVLQDGRERRLIPLDCMLALRNSSWFLQDALMSAGGLRRTLPLDSSVDEEGDVRVKAA
jgi:hypothetical protein